MKIDPIALITHGYLCNTSNALLYISRNLKFNLQEQERNVNFNIQKIAEFNLSLQPTNMNLKIDRKNIKLNIPKIKVNIKKCAT